MLKSSLIFLFLLLESTISYGQNQLFIQNSIEDGFLGEIDYHLYYGENLIYTQCNLLNNDTTLLALPTGKYHILYNTLFGIERIDFEFESATESKTLLLPAEKLSESKQNKTYSSIENLKENETLVLNYTINGCFVSINKTSTITKQKSKYYRVKKGKLHPVNKKTRQSLIEYEKMVRNIKLDENLHSSYTFTTCDESMYFTKGSDTLVVKTLPCGTWSELNKMVEKF